MDGGGAPRLQSSLVDRTRVALVSLEVESRVVIGLGSHDPIPGDLGQHRGRRDREGGGVSPNDPQGLTSHEVPFAVDQHPVNPEPQSGQGSLRGQPLSGRHPQPVALGRAGVSDRPGNTPPGDPIEESFPLVFGEQLRIANLVDAAVLGEDGSTDTDRSRPGTPAHLVDPDQGLLAAPPQLSLHRQVRSVRLEGPAKLGDGGRHGSEDTRPGLRGRAPVS